MKKLYLRLFLAVAGLAVCSFSAKAQVVDELTVKIPFSFVAGGRTLPAGEYRVTRLRDEEPRMLLLRSRENTSNAVLLRVDEQKDFHGNTHLGFVTAGDQYFLLRIASRDHVYTFSVPRADTLLTMAPQQTVAAPTSAVSK